jgi:transcriptional regulator with XRE-family HTH domain
MYPDDSGKDLATVLSTWLGAGSVHRKAMELPRSTYYAQLERGTLITADNLRKAATNLGINRAELLTRYRLIDPEEVRSLAEEIGGPHPLCVPPFRTGGPTRSAATILEKRAKISRLQPRDDAPPL